MAQRNATKEEQVVGLLQNLLAIELWRSGLSQADIGKRLGVAKATVSAMLNGVARHVNTFSTEAQQ